MDREWLLEISWRTLFYGCVREAVAAVYSVARIGIQDAHVWERPLAYVADDNEGNVGVIEFRDDGAVCAVNARDSCRPFDFESCLRKAPSAQRDFLRRVHELPLLREASGVTAMFWTSGEAIELPEDWESALHSGMDLFWHECLPDADWSEEACQYYYGMGPAESRLVIAIARRSRMGAPLVELAESELRLLIPEDSKYADEARKWLFGEGLFSMAHP